MKVFENVCSEKYTACSAKNKKLKNCSHFQRIPTRYLFILITSAMLVNFLLLLDFLDQSMISTSRRRKTDNSPTLIDLKDFKYLIRDPTSTRSNIENPFFVIIVASDPSNNEMRQTIRQTWAHADDRAATYFALGIAESEELQRKIELENDEYNDIIQGNFIDNSRNLTYKHVMALKWFKDAYPDVKYLVKMDDDVFCNVAAVYDYLLDNKHDRGFVMGIYHEPEACPRIGTKGVTYDEYATDYLPSYAESSSVIYSNDVVHELYEKSSTIDFFFLDDVYVSGLLRYQLNFGIQSMDKYIISAKNIEKLFKSTVRLPDPYNFMFSIKPVTMQQQRVLWDRTEWYRFGSKIEPTV